MEFNRKGLNYENIEINQRGNNVQFFFDFSP